MTHAHSRRWELELLNGPFEEDGLYTWLYEGSKTKLYLMTIGMLVGALGLCMIQIWPLWLKIGVWWCSVTFLTTFGILCVVRLVLFCLMFIVGFRGIWLFPNLFDDNQTFAGSFMPIFGRGDPCRRRRGLGRGVLGAPAEEGEEEGGERRRQVARRQVGEEAVVDRRRREEKEKKEEPAFQFGLINILLIFGAGAIGCLKLGFFDGENVPDFVAKRDDLEYYFKTLAPPEMPNKTDDGKPERRRRRPVVWGRRRSSAWARFG